MPGKGPSPAANRRRRNAPSRGDWKPAEGHGWQHGPAPDAPDGLSQLAQIAWDTWFRAWFASHWTPDDLPGLRQVAHLYDQCERYFEDPYVEKETAKGETIYVSRPNPASELRQLMDNYGITPKGQQDRRWVRPDGAKSSSAKPAPTPYAHLRVVGQ